jgi:hypothetical protein
LPHGDPVMRCFDMVMLFGIKDHATEIRFEPEVSTLKDIPHDVTSRLNWPNIAALAVWLVSVGLLLTRAVRSRKPQPASPTAC